MYDFKTVSVQDIIDAMNKNGYKWHQGSWFGGDSEITGACIMQQAALNLGVVGYSLRDALNSRSRRGIGDRIISFNDYEATSYEDALQYAIELLKPLVKEVLYVRVHDYEDLNLESARK